MVFEEVCNTDLSLGSSSFDRTENHLQSHHHQQHKKILLSLKFDRAVPSLTLGFSSEEKQEDPVKIIDVSKIVQGDQSTVLYRQTSSLSVVSLYSNSSVKRERDLSAGEEVDVERGPSKASDEQDEEGSSRKKLRLTNGQSAILEDSFKQQSTLNPNQKQALAKQLNLRPRQVEVWFQNRRARAKLKQIAGDCDLLKKHCETLTDENRRLQKELQELMKERKLNAPFYYMQRPASTLTMCPSCERIGGGENSSKSTFSIGAKTDHFYNTFTHPSAAC